MKTLEELYNEVIADDNLKQAFFEAAQNNTTEDFLKSNGCDATAEDLLDFLKNRNKETVELSFDELSEVAGGTCNVRTMTESVVSVLGGIGCAIWALGSLTNGMHIGQEGSNEGRLCNEDKNKFWKKNY